jgi:hypothetical protein
MNRRSFLKSTAITIIGLNFASNQIFAQTGKDIFSLTKILKKAEKEEWCKLNLNEIIIKVGSEFIGVPYVGGTLDVNTEESCIVSQEGLDCVTFMETSLCAARIIKKKKYTIEDLKEEVTFTRYRDGKLKGYESRLHYTKEWILNNIKKGVIKDITGDLGGVPFKNEVFFMSKNPKYYSSLKSNKELTAKIAKIEENINSQKILYIPTTKISSIEKKLQSGDLIAIATSKDGLDYSHVGLINKGKDGIARFFHASLKQKKVYLDTSISEYLASVKTNIGITVLRPI